MGTLKLTAKARISTSAGSFSAGEVFEIEERYAQMLLQEGYAELYKEDAIKQTTQKDPNPNKELNKLNMEELKKLAEAIGFEASESKKQELIARIIQEAKENQAYGAILELSAKEIKEQLDE